MRAGPQPREGLVAQEMRRLLPDQGIAIRSLIITSHASGKNCREPTTVAAGSRRRDRSPREGKRSVHDAGANAEVSAGLRCWAGSPLPDQMTAAEHWTGVVAHPDPLMLSLPSDETCPTTVAWTPQSRQRTRESLIPAGLHRVDPNRQGAQTTTAHWRRGASRIRSDAEFWIIVRTAASDHERRAAERPAGASQETAF